MWVGETYIGTVLRLQDGTLKVPYHITKTYPGWMFWKMYRHLGFDDIAYIPVNEKVAQLTEIWTEEYGLDVPDQVLCFLVTLCRKSGVRMCT